MQSTRRLLHWVYKIKDLQSSLDLLKEKLGIVVQRHEEFDLKCEAACNGEYDNAWSKTMVARGSEKEYFALELVTNYGQSQDYKEGNHIQNLEFYLPKLQVEHDSFKIDSYTFCRINEVYMKNYQVLCDNPINLNEDFKFLTLKVNDLKTSLKFFTEKLSMKVFTKHDIIQVSQDDPSFTEIFKTNHQNQLFCLIGYNLNDTIIKIVQHNDDSKVDQNENQGRIAFTIDEPLSAIQNVLEQERIKYGPVVLPTEGKADVEVVIITTYPEEYEICYVGKTGFHDLCTTKPGDAQIDYEKRAQNFKMVQYFQKKKLKEAQKSE